MNEAWKYQKYDNLFDNENRQAIAHMETRFLNLISLKPLHLEFGNSNPKLCAYACNEMKLRNYSFIVSKTLYIVTIYSSFAHSYVTEATR